MCLQKAKTSAHAAKPPLAATLEKATTSGDLFQLLTGKRSSLDNLLVPPQKRPATTRDHSVEAELSQLGKARLVQATRVSTRSTQTVEKLLAEGESIDQTDPIVENTALHYAAFYNALAIAKLLVSRGADPNLANRAGLTPLMFAIEKGHTAIAKLLLAAPLVDLSAADKQGFTALHKAVLNGNMEIFRALLESDRCATKLDIHAMSAQGLTALHQAAYHGNASMVRLLIEHGADVNKSHTSKTTALHLAASRNHTDVVRILVAHGALVDAQDAHQRTALHYACMFGHFDVASFLVGANASVTLLDKQRQSPSSIAARDGMDELSAIFDNVPFAGVPSPNQEELDYLFLLDTLGH